MLRRDRQIRMQIHQLMDACLFALGFWLAYLLRSSPEIIDLFGLQPVNEFHDYRWLYIILIPAAPFILEAQGFYNRPTFCSRRTTAWLLFKSCFITTLVLILVLFFFKMTIARAVIVWFGFVTFGLVFAKEELLRSFFQSKLARTSFRRKFILIGTKEETARMGAELKAKSDEAIEILAEFDLNETSLDQLIAILHEHSVNGVILSAKHTYFEQVEAVIRACEFEGVEAWLVAEFFKTQISRTSLDDFYGRPVLVFRTTPEASWQGIVKQLLDRIGAILLLSLLAPFFLVIGLLIRLGSPGPVLFR